MRGTCIRYEYWYNCKPKGSHDGKGEVGPWLIECVFDSAGAKL